MGAVLCSQGPLEQQVLHQYPQLQKKPEFQVQRISIQGSKEKLQQSYQDVTFEEGQFQQQSQQDQIGQGENYNVQEGQLQQQGQQDSTGRGQSQKDLSQYNFKIQQVKNSIEDQLCKEKKEFQNLYEQQLISKQNIENEKTKCEDLLRKKIYLQGYLNQQIEKLSTEVQKQYEKDIEEFKKSANELNFENQPSAPILSLNPSFNVKEKLENSIKEAEQLKNEFYQSWKDLSRIDLQKESEQFNLIYLDIKSIKLEINTVKKDFQKLSEELQTNNHILSERINFNKKMDANLIQLESQIKTKFNEIFYSINKKQTENVQQIQSQLNFYIKLSKEKQTELDNQNKIIKNLKESQQDLQNLITQYEFENNLNINLNQQLKEQINLSEKNFNQQIKNLEKMKDENTNIVQAIKQLRIQFEEEISRFELDSQNQMIIEKNEINDNIENQIKVADDYNQILDNFQQMMNKSLQILSIQNDRLVSIQSQLEKSQKINIENQENIEKKDKEIFELKLLSKEKNKQIENLQNQIEELEQNNKKLKKEAAKYRKQQEKKYESSSSGNFSSEIYKIDIFFQSENPYTHTLCSTKAKVNSDAMVSCDGGCQSFQLKSAVFDLQNRQVYEQLSFQKLPKDHVQVGGKYRSLVDSSLQKAGINEEEKRDFLEIFRISYLDYPIETAQIMMN